MKYLLIYLREDNQEDCIEVEASCLEEACQALGNPLEALPDFEAIAVHNQLTQEDLDWVSCLLDTTKEQFTQNVDVVKLSLMECA